MNNVYNIDTGTLDGTRLDLTLPVVCLLKITPVEKATQLIDSYNHFASLVEELGLYNVGELKPLLNVSSEPRYAINTT